MTRPESVLSTVSGPMPSVYDVRPDVWRQYKMLRANKTYEKEELGDYINVFLLLDGGTLLAHRSLFLIKVLALRKLLRGKWQKNALV